MDVHALMNGAISAKYDISIFCLRKENRFSVQNQFFSFGYQNNLFDLVKLKSGGWGRIF